MTAGERRLLEFLGGRLEAMLHRPDQWGPPLVVEQLVLQLLEMRALVLDPAVAVNQKHRIIRSFVRFMKESVPDATPEPLAVQLERQGRGAELRQRGVTLVSLGHPRDLQTEQDSGSTSPSVVRLCEHAMQQLPSYVSAAAAGRAPGPGLADRGMQA